MKFQTPSLAANGTSYVQALTTTNSKLQIPTIFPHHFPVEFKGSEGVVLCQIARVTKKLTCTILSLSHSTVYCFVIDGVRSSTATDCICRNIRVILEELGTVIRLKDSSTARPDTYRHK